MNNIIKCLLLLVFLLFLYSLIGRMPQADDAWLGEHAYWQTKLGYVKSEIYPKHRFWIFHYSGDSDIFLRFYIEVQCQLLALSDK